MAEALKTLNSEELTPLIYSRQYGGSRPRDDYSYWLDKWFFAFKKGLELSSDEAIPFIKVKERVDQLLTKNYWLAYWSGGFDLGPHANIISTLRFYLPNRVRVVVGIEPDSYIKNKEREPQFDLITRLSAVGLLLKQEGILGFVFPIPERGELDSRQFYEKLVGEIGMHRRPGCFHLYTKDDPNSDIKVARMLNPEPWCCIKLMRDKNGRAISTTTLLSQTG